MAVVLAIFVAVIVVIITINVRDDRRGGPPSGGCH